MTTISLDEESKRQIRQFIFRPFALSIIVGVSISIVISAVAAVCLGVTVQQGDVSFSLVRSDGWIVFTIFGAAATVITVVSYYRIREDYTNIIDDLLTPFRRSLIGEWEVHWSDMVCEERQNKLVLIDRETRDYCQMKIDPQTGKLLIASELNGHPILENWSKNIEDITINLREKRMSFYDIAKFCIRPEAILGQNTEREFEAKFFVILDTMESDAAGAVNVFRGSWYDLDGMFAKLKAKMAQIEHPSIVQQLDFPRTGRIRYEKRPPLPGPQTRRH